MQKSDRAARRAAESHVLQVGPSGPLKPDSPHRACVLPRSACALPCCSASASVPRLLGTSGPPRVLGAVGPPQPRRVERREAAPAVERGRPAPAEPFELIHSSYTLRRLGTRSLGGCKGCLRAGNDDADLLSPPGQALLAAAERAGLPRRAQLFSQPRSSLTRTVERAGEPVGGRQRRSVGERERAARTGLSRPSSGLRSCFNGLELCNDSPRAQVPDSTNRASGERASKVT